MKLLFSGLLGIGFLLVLMVLMFNRLSQGSKISISPSQPSTPVISTVPNKLTKTLFVPYWGLTSQSIEEDGYATLVYFGISVNEQGIIVDDPGTKGMNAFLTTTDSSKKRLLAIRMLDSDVNSSVIDSQTAQQTVISQSIQIAKDKGFDGVVLDFEFSALAFNSVIDKVDSFMENFSKQARSQHLSFSPMLYGDSFFRPRPYDVSKVGLFSDTIYIMAYNFHKAKGESGPNFPLHGNEIYGYDMTQMISDFSSHVNTSKLTVVYGMYGYDWTLDNKKQSVGVAQSLGTIQMQQKFSNCTLESCSFSRDTRSSEMHGSYSDGGKKHQVWYEDAQSVQEKTTFLQTKGFTSVGYWAYSYF